MLKSTENRCCSCDGIHVSNSLLACGHVHVQRTCTPYLDCFINKFLSKFISAYRKTYSLNHVLIRIIENWKKALDLNKFTGAVLMDLTKAFDSIPHDLLIAKMHAYGFDENSLVFFYSCLKRHTKKR